MLDDSRKTEESRSRGAKRAGCGAHRKAALTKAGSDFEAAEQAPTRGRGNRRSGGRRADRGRDARAETQTREADARAERSEAEGEMNALRAEDGALAKLVERDTAEGGQILDRLQVEHGL